MAVAFNAKIYDGQRMKIVNIKETAANALANEVAIVFTANGMTAFQGGATPLLYGAVKIVSAADEAVDHRIHTVSSTGFTFRKISTGLGATTIEWLVWLFVPRGIAG